MDLETFRGCQQGRSTQPSEGNAASTSSGFSKHFTFRNDLETFFSFINRPLEIAAEGGSKDCFVSPSPHPPSLPVLIQLLRVDKSGPGGVACHA